MWFSHAYSAAPLCAPSRAALLTGVHPNRSGIYYNSHAYRRAPNFIAGVTNLPGLFLRNGYLTAGHGKIGHNSYVRDELPDFSPGYFKTLDNTKDRDVSYTNTDLLDHLMPGTRTSIPGQASRSWDWGILPDDWDRDDPKKMQQDTEHSRKGSCQESGQDAFEIRVLNVAAGGKGCRSEPTRSVASTCRALRRWLMLPIRTHRGRNSILPSIQSYSWACCPLSWHDPLPCST